jgi:hypothetical protein
VKNRLPLWITLTLATSLTAAEFHVAPNGTDINPGTAEQPFATLERARDALREFKAANGGTLKEPVKVILHRGEYVFSRTFELTPQDSGTKNAPVCYLAAKDETPVITSARSITGWKKHDEHIWVAAVPKGWRFHNLYVNGAPQQVARTPNTDVKGWRSWPRAQGNAPLTPEGMRVTVPAGLLKALPDNGDVEVKCDAKGNRVEQTTPPLATAGASAFDQRVRYVEFRGLTFEGTDRLPEDQWPKDWLKRNAENPDGALCLQGVEACTITDCTFRNCGAYGVVLDHYAQRVSVLGNEMTRLGSGGVQATGYGPGTLDVNGHHVIRPENARAAGREGRPNDRDVRVPEHWRIRDFQSASHPSEGSGRRALALLRFRGRRRHLQLQTVPVHRGRDRQRSIVPLMRGCAMVRLRK